MLDSTTVDTAVLVITRGLGAPPTAAMHVQSAVNRYC